MIVASSKVGTTLFGKDLYESSLVQQWISIADSDLSPSLANWLYPIVGYREFSHVYTEDAKKHVKRILTCMNQHLALKTFLVGECVTLADISIVCALKNAYEMVFDPAFRNEFPNVNRWYITCRNQPFFLQVMGAVSLCEKMQVFKKAEKKKEEKPAAAEKPAKVEKPAKKPKEEEEKEETFEDEKPKGKNPLDPLPPSALNLDEWKRCYSNNETRPTAVNWFWSNFDPAGYAIWKVDYKYNDELTLTFMSSNLVGGFFQRLERARKYAFGCLVVLGADNKNEITGYFVVRGHEIPPEISEAADFESYTFVKVDAGKPEVRENFNAVIAWDEKIYGKPFADGKVFK